LTNQHLPKKFSHAVNILKHESRATHHISNEGIAQRLGITLDQYNTYYKSDVIVEGLSELLYEKFKEYFPNGGSFRTIEFEIDVPDDEE